MEAAILKILTPELEVKVLHPDEVAHLQFWSGATIANAWPFDLQCEMHSASVLVPYQMEDGWQSCPVRVKVHSSL